MQRAQIAAHVRHRLLISWAIPARAVPPPPSLREPQTPLELVALGDVFRARARRDLAGGGAQRRHDHLQLHRATPAGRVVHLAHCVSPRPRRARTSVAAVGARLDSSRLAAVRAGRRPALDDLHMRGFTFAPGRRVARDDPIGAAPRARAGDLAAASSWMPRSAWCARGGARARHRWLSRPPSLRVEAGDQRDRDMLCAWATTTSATDTYTAARPSR